MHSTCLLILNYVRSLNHTTHQSHTRPLCTLSQHTASHHNTSDHSTSHHIKTHQMAPHYITHHITPHYITPHHIRPLRIPPHHITTHQSTSDHSTSHYTTSDQSAPHHTTPHHIRRPNYYSPHDTACINCAHTQLARDSVNHSLLFKSIHNLQFTNYCAFSYFVKPTLHRYICTPGEYHIHQVSTTHIR